MEEIVWGRKRCAARGKRKNENKLSANRNIIVRSKKGRPWDRRTKRRSDVRTGGHIYRLTDGQTIGVPLAAPVSMTVTVTTNEVIIGLL